MELRRRILKFGALALGSILTGREMVKVLGLHYEVVFELDGKSSGKMAEVKSIYKSSGLKELDDSFLAGGRILEIYSTDAEIVYRFASHSDFFSWKEAAGKLGIHHTQYSARGIRSRRREQFV